MSTTQNDYTVTNEWTDLAATVTGAASVDALYQCVSPDTVQIVFGGASAPTGKTGVILRQFESYEGNAANVWVRALGSPEATLSVTTP